MSLIAPLAGTALLPILGLVGGAQDALGPGDVLEAEIDHGAEVVSTEAMLRAGRGVDPQAAGRHHQVVLDTAGTYRVELFSDFFDTYLIVRDGDGAILGEDDSSLIGTHSGVVLDVAEPATLHVTAASTDGHRGAYRLVVEEGPPEPVDPSRRTQLELEEEVRRLHVLEGAFGPDHPDVARGLVRLANILIEAGELRDALSVLERALAIQQVAPDDGHGHLATLLGNLAVVQSYLGQFTEAMQTYDLAIAAEVARYGEKHPSVATSLTSLGDLQRNLGLLDEARTNTERAVQILQDTVGEDHWLTGVALNNLGLVARYQGDYELARESFDHALAIQVSELGLDDLNTIITRNNIALLSIDMGDYVRARELAEESLSTLREIRRMDHPDIGWTHQVIGLSQLRLGDSVAGLESLNRALEIRVAAYGENHPEVGETLAMMVMGHIMQGKLQSAREHLDRAVSVLQSSLGSDHSSVGHMQGYQAELARRDRDFDAAIEYQEQAVAVIEASLGWTHVDAALVRSNYSVILRYAGRLEDARHQAEIALQRYEQLFGTSRRVVTEAASNLAGILLDLGEIEQARELIDRYAVAAEADFDAQLAGLSEHEAFLSVEQLSLEHDLALSPQLVGDGAWMTSAYDRLLFWKAKVLRSIQMSRQRANQLSEEARDHLERLRAINARLSRISTLGLGEGALDTEQLGKLMEEHARHQRELTRLLKGPRQALPTWEALRDGLHPGTALVDLDVRRQYEAQRPEEGVASSSGTWTEPRFSAWITVPGAERPIRVELGASALIDEAVIGWRRALDAGSGAERNRVLSDLVWRPLEPHLDGIHTVLVSPDGSLAAVSFGALLDADGRHLIESRRFVSLTDPTIVLHSEANVADRPERLLAVGGVDYGQAAAPDGVPRSEPTEASSLRGGWTEAWAPLPRTGPEAEGIVALHEQLRPDADRLLLSSSAPSEEALKDELPRSTIAHLATHGYFQPEFLPSLIESARASVNAGLSDALPDLSRQLGGATRLEGLHPGLLSGLVCAGASSGLGPSRDDGYLTAEEVAWLDLSGVDLVVLSACDTALGRSRSGEGLLGLRRAFLAAGAGCVISSLWSVPDQDTARLMEHFYTNVWERGMSAGEALHEAQLAMLAENRARYGLGLPRTWAAFVCDGSID